MDSRYITLYAILFVNLTNTQFLETKEQENNNAPINLNKSIQSQSKYTKLSNNNDYNENQNIINALIKQLAKTKNQESKVNICVNKGNIYEFHVNTIFCKHGLESNRALKMDNSGRSYYNTHWLDYNKPYIYLTKNDFNSFSKDYVDINDLGRTDLDRFSKDYLDINDLARREDRRSHIINGVESYPRYLLVLGNIFDFFNLRKSIKRNSKKRNKVRSDSSDSSDETSFGDLDGSDEKIKSNRFKIVKPQGSSVTTSEEETSAELPVEKKKIAIKNENQSDSEEESQTKKDRDDYVYIQGRNRIINDSDGRKRLEHFMPKRFHWDEEEFKNLGYYWFNGHKGRYAEAWRPGNL